MVTHYHFGGTLRAAWQGRRALPPVARKNHHPQHMTKKQTLRHLLPNGKVATRTTARAYSHVVVARDEREHTEAEAREQYAYLEHDDPGRFRSCVAERIAAWEDASEDHVMGWYLSQTEADLEATAVTQRLGYTARVEPVNGGEREATPR